jgi:predicted DNA-binding transcriptional regulator AlpA
MADPLPPGARLIAPRKAQEKLDIKNSKFWDSAKNDPNFPRIIYLGPRMPRMWEHELDRYIEQRAAAGRAK